LVIFYLVYDDIITFNEVSIPIGEVVKRHGDKMGLPGVLTAHPASTNCTGTAQCLAHKKKGVRLAVHPPFARAA